MFDLVSVGHFSIDSIFLPERKNPFVTLGGSAAYASFAARRLDARVGVISSVGGDFPEAYKWWIEKENVSFTVFEKVENAKTTRFELRYNEELSERKLLLKAKGPQLTTEGLSNPFRASSILIAPIVGEITCEIAEKLRDSTDLLAVDAQGFVRQFDQNGSASCSTLIEPRILRLADVYKSSLEEIQAATGMVDVGSAVNAVHQRGVKTVLVTLGDRGTIVSSEETEYTVPAYKPLRVVDPTGAGDAFMGSFLSEYVNGENLLRCVCVGVAAASFVVESVGPTSFGAKPQIYQRARELYEKGIKQ